MRRRGRSAIPRAARLAIGALLVTTATLSAQGRVAARDPAVIEDALVRQSQAAIITERRLADEREAALLKDLEGRILSARRRLDAAMKAGASTLAELASARTALETERRSWGALVDSIALREALARTELEQFRAEMRGMLASASPEKLLALERFGDGDRVGAWSVIQEITEAGIRARTAAVNEKSATELRELARLREVMRTNGEAKISDVLAILDKAVALNPQDPAVQVLRSANALRVGAVIVADSAARSALRISRSAADSSYALDALAQVLIERGHFDLAAQSLSVRIVLLERMIVSAPASLELLWDLADARRGIGSLQGQRGMLDSARVAFEGSVRIYQLVSEARPDDPMVGVTIAEMLNRMSSLAYADNDDAAAVRYLAQSVAHLRELRRHHPHHRAIATSLANSIRLSGELATIRGSLDSARASLLEAHRVFQELTTVDESDVGTLRLLRRTIEHLINLDQQSSNLGAAESHASELIAVSRRIVRLEPRNALSQYDLSQSLFYMGSLLLQLQRPIDAQAAVSEGLAISREVHANSPSVPEARRLLRQMLTQMGDLDRQLGDTASAIARYQEALVHARGLVSADSGSTRDRRSLAWLLQRLAAGLHSQELWRAVLQELDWLRTRGALEPGELQELEEARRRAGLAPNRESDTSSFDLLAEGGWRARDCFGAFAVVGVSETVTLRISVGTGPRVGVS